MKKHAQKIAKGAYFLFALTLLLNTNSAYAQFAVQTNLPAQQLVEEVLLGEGISVSNISYNGSALSIGKFTNSNNATLQLQSGIVLSTGRVIDIASANNSQNAQYSTYSGSDASLQTLLPNSPIFDASVLEFDFVSTTDSIEFRFAFGSEEYSEWLGSSYNDVFGFFINGVNPNGGSYSDYNIAVVPGTNTPISTNTINNGINNTGPCINCNYYNDNTNGAHIQFDGITNVIIAKVMVEPCQTYHIKIAIADGGDHSYDSGVFLEANSFTTKGLDVTPIIYSNTYSQDTISESCDSAAIDLTLSSAYTVDTYVPVITSGTAIEGTDYVSLPDSILFSAGVDSLRLYINPISDNSSENIESIKIMVPISSCAFDTSVFYIKNYEPLQVSVNNPSNTCENSQITLTTSVIGGLMPYTYLWGNGNNSSSITFTGNQDTSIYLSVSDACGNTDTIIKNLIINETPIYTYSLSSNTACFGDSIYGNINTTQQLSYSWYLNNNILNTTSNNIAVSVSNNSVLKVKVTNQNGCSTTSTKNITANPQLSFTVTPTLNSICEGDTSKFYVHGNYNYQWSDSNNVSYISQNADSLISTPTQSANLWVIATDNNGCTDSTMVQQIVNPSPNVVLNSSHTEVCIGNTVSFHATGALNYQWWPTGSLNQTNGSNATVTPTQSTTYTVEGTNLQGCSSRDSVNIDVYNNISLYTHSTNTNVCLGDSVRLSGHGTSHYYWIVNGNNVAIDTNILTFYPTKNTNIRLVGVDDFGCSDTVSKLITIDPTFKFITADTVCLGNKQLVQIISPNPNLQYQWSNIDIENNTYEFNTPTTFSVTAFNPNTGCSFSKSKTINIYPNIPITISSPSSTICSSESALLLRTSSSPLINNYTWQGNTNWSSTNGDSARVNPTTSANNYVLLGEDINGCIHSSNTTNINVNATPNVQISPNNPIVQPNSIFTLTASGATYYNWFPTASIASVTYNSTVSLKTDSITHIWAYGANANGCIGKDSVIIFPSPLVRIKTVKSKLCYGDSTLLTAYCDTLVTYAWSTGETTSSIWVKPMMNTNYMVTVTNSGGQTNSANKIIIAYAKPDLQINPDPVFICGNNPTTIRVSGARTYSWFPSEGLNRTIGNSVQTTSNHNITYSVVGIDDFGCIDTATVNAFVVNNANVGANYTNVTICEGESVNLIGNGTPFYQWRSGKYLNDSNSKSVICTPLDTTVYTLTGTDYYNCKAEMKVTVNVKPKPILTINTDSTNICLGNSLTLSAKGATYYSWKNPTISNTSSPVAVINPQNTTIYTLVGFNQYGCTDTLHTYIGVHAYPNININPTSTHICPNDSFVVQASGGANKYKWFPNNLFASNTGVSQNISLDTTTEISVIGTSQFGCSDTAYTTINVEPIVKINTSSQDICKGDNISIGTYTNINTVSYLWSTGETTSSINPTPNTSTNYKVTVTSTSTNCQSTDNVSINVINKPTVSIISALDTVCPGTANLLTASGAVTYNWYPNNLVSNSYGNSVFAFPPQNTTYTVVGTNLFGCVDSANITLNTFTAPTVNVSPNFTSICSGSSQLLVADGAQSYSWSPNLGISDNFGDSITVFPNTNINYMVVGSDNNQCTDTAYAYFTTSTNATITPVSPELCYGETMTLDAVSANTPQQYLWSTGDTTQTINVSPLQDTNYYVTLTYMSGCSKISETSLVVNHDSSVVISAASSQVCNNHTSTIFAANCSSYNWFGTGVNTINDTSASIAPASDSWYVVEGISSHGCSSFDSTYITLYNQPIISLTASQTSICQGDSIALYVTGANTYLWPNASTNDSIYITPTTSGLQSVIGFDQTLCSDTAYINIQTNSLPNISISPQWPIICPNDTTTVTVTSNGSVNWGNTNSIYYNSINSTQTEVFPQESELYQISSTSINGCVKDTFVRCHVKRSAIMYLSTDTANICLGDSLQVTVLGANSLTWSPQPYIYNSTNDTVIIKTLANTNYVVTGMSTDGCSSDLNALYNATTLPAINITTNTPAVCENQNVLLSAACAAPNVEWQWSTGDTNQSINYTATQSTQISVIGRSNNCIDTLDFNLTVFPNPTVAFSNANPVVCNGDSIMINPTLLSPTVTTLNGEYYNYTETGIISYKYIDSLGCSDTAYANLSMVNNPEVSIISSEDTICQSDSLVLNLGLSSSNMTIIWNNGSQTNNLFVSPLNSTTYYVSAIDSNNCIDRDTFNLFVNPQPQFNFITANPSVCIGDSTIIGINSNNTNLSYTWNTNDSLDYIVAGPTTTTTYSITATDNNNCSNYDSVILTVNSLPIPNMQSSSTLYCEGDTIMICASNCPDITEYKWNTGCTSQTISHVINSDTSYQVTITDINNCVNYDTLDIIMNHKPTITVFANDSLICSEDTINLWHVTNHPLSNITWSDGQTTASILSAPLSPQHIWAEITDTSFCTNRDSVYIHVNHRPSSQIIAENPICQEDSSLISYEGDASNNAIFDWSFTNSASVIAGDSGSYNVHWEDAGEHMIYLSVYDNNCYSFPDSSLIIVNAMPNIDFYNITSLNCDSTAVMFECTNTDMYYEWNFGDPLSYDDVSNDQNPSYTYNAPGEYSVSLSVISAQGCKSTLIKESLITVYPKPEAKATVSSRNPDINKSEVRFFNMSPTECNLEWNFGEPISGIYNTSTENSPWHVYQNTGEFLSTLTLTNEFGCTDTAKNLIVVGRYPTLYAPTAFSPNGDGLNDRFEPQFSEADVKEYQIYIFNRQGRVIYESQNYNDGWNGTDQLSEEALLTSVFTYKISVVDGNDVIRHFSGAVTIVK